MRRQDGVDRARIADVEVGVGRGDDLGATRVAGGGHVAAQHPARPGDQNLHGILISALSPTIIRSVFGRPSPRESFTLRPSRLASIRESRSETLEPESRIECSTSARATVTPESIEV